jgi:hypothetical protein
MRPERIVEIAGLPEGVTFSPAVLDRVTERLRDTGVFSAVALGEQPLGPGDTMDIVATLTESPPRRFGFGAELSTDEGARVSAFWLHRNLFGGAERLRIEGEIRGIGEGELSVDGVDGIDAGLRARISRPATFTPDTLAYGEIDIAALDEPTFRLVGLSVEAGVEHWFSPKLEGALGVGLRTFVFEDIFGDRESATLLYLPAELTWDNRDDMLNPTTGTYMIGTVAPFVTLGDGVGARLTADARGYLGFGEDDRTVLAGRAQAGRPVRRRYRSDPARLPVLFRRLRHGSGAGIPVARRDPERCSIRGAQLRHAVGRGAAGPWAMAISASSCSPTRAMSGPMPRFRMATGTRARDRACAMTRPSARSASISRPRCAAAASVRTSSSISVSGRPSDAPPDPFPCAVAALALPVAAQDDDRGRLIRFLESQLSDGADRQVRIDGFRGALSSEAELDRLSISDADGEWLVLETRGSTGGGWRCLSGRAGGEG